MSALSFFPAGNVAIIWGVSVLLQVTVVTAVALLMARFLNRNAVARHWVLLAALSFVWISPITAAILQKTGLAAISVTLLDNQPVPAESVMGRATQRTRTRISGSAFPASGETNVGISDGADGQQQGRELAVASSRVSNSLTVAMLLRIAMPFVLLIWLVGATAFFARLCHRWKRLATILRCAEPLANTSCERLFADVCGTLGISKTPPVFSSPNLRSPVAAGIWRPRVVLPEGLVAQLTPNQVRQVLIHEMAHLLRRDQVVAFLQGFVVAAFWFHPFVRILNRQLARAREEICDNYVLSCTDAPSYSRMLLRLAEMLGSSDPQPAAVGLFTSHWKLETRVAGILNEGRSRMTHLTMRSAVLVVMVSLVLAALAAGTNVSIAGDGNPAADAPSADADTLVSTVDGKKILLSESTQVLLYGAHGSKVTPSGGNRSLWLPAHLNLRAKMPDGPTARFTLTSIPDHPSLTLYASLECLPKTQHTSRFLEQNAISLEIKKQDIHSAASGTLTKFIYLPHRKPNEKWAGHLGILTMGAVSADTYQTVLKNLAERGFLLAVFQLSNRQTGNQVPHKTADGAATSDASNATAKRESEAKELPVRIRSREFPDGDDVTIESFVELDPKQNAHRYEVRGRYRLQSKDAADLQQYCANGKVRGDKRIQIQKGEGTFRFTFSVVEKGDLHLSYYPAQGGSSFGSLYYDIGASQQRRSAPRSRAKNANNRSTVKWRTDETKFFRIHSSAEFQEDAKRVREYLEQTVQNLQTEFGVNRVPPLLTTASIDVYVHPRPTERAREGQVSLRTESKQGVYHATIDILTPSAHRSGSETNVGEPMDGNYIFKNLVHEYSTIVLDRLTREKSSGWSFFSAPAWFVQGYEEYLGLMLSSKHSRQVTFEKYRDLLRADPARVSPDFKVKNPYVDGAVLLQFLHETYGKEKVQAFLVSDASDFWSSVNQVTGHDRAEIFKARTQWLAGI